MVDGSLESQELKTKAKQNFPLVQVVLVTVESRLTQELRILTIYRDKNLQECPWRGGR